MGVRSSIFYYPKDVPPPRRQEDDYPLVDPIGIGKGMAQGCEWKGSGVCQLAVPQGVSSSGAKLYRDEGTIRRDQCRKYARDLQKVSKDEKSFEEVKRDLIAGLYYEELPNQYCRQMVYAAEDLKTVLTPDKLPLDKVRYMSIRQMSDSGSYSSVTKLFIKPAIPFEVEFNGKPHKITVMTLLHPSPIRMENIQHDAMLTLGDPGAGNNDGLVVLIPLQGAIVAGPSGAFLNKVVRYLTGVLQPDPATGDYKTIDIPTGNDWDLSKMFPGTPGEGGKTFVSNVGYYVWSGYPPLELRPEGAASPSTARKWWELIGVWTWFLREPGVQKYAWQPSSTPPIRYVMLSKPALVSSMDLQTIRMLPVTPVTEAVAPILKHTLSYRKADSCPAPLPTAGAITDLFSRPVREGLENQCDPFAPGNFPAPDGHSGFVQVAIAILTTLGVGLAIYLAVLFFTKTKWGQWVANQGTIAGNQLSQSFVSDSRKREKVDTRFEVTAAMEAAEETAAAKKKAAEEARVKKEEEADAKRKASLATFKAPKRPTTAPVTPEDVVVEPKLPSPGTPAAAAVAAAEPQESRAETYRRRAKEVAEKVKADADKPPAQPEVKAPDAPPKEDTEAAERNKRWAETTVAEFKKAEARIQEAKEDAEEAKARARKAEEAADDAKLEAEELAKKPKPRTGSFAAPTTGPTPLEVALAKKEAAKQAAEAKRAAEEAAAKEADIKRLSEEAAKRASAAAERQVKNVPKPTTSDPVFRQDNPMLKNKAFSKAAPSPSTIQAETRSLATKVKEVQAAGKPPSALSAAQEAALTDDVMKESEERLKPLRTKTSGALADAMRAANALSETTLRKNWPVWLRFEKEKTFHKSSISPLLQSFMAYSTALEGSKLDRLKRAEYTTVLTKFRDSLLSLLEASKTRLETIEVGAPDARVVKGGRRHRRQRKSTRRYVA